MDRWLVLEPLDTVVVRDGRLFDAGAQSVARVVAPSPASIAGAVGAAFGAPPGAGLDPAALGRVVPRAVRGPVAVRHDGLRWRPLFPMPRDVVERDQEWVRLSVKPSAANGIRSDLGGIGLLTGRGDTSSGWWSGAALAAYLDRGRVSPPGDDPAWVVEHRVGLARRDRAAVEGMLYGAEHLRPVGRLGFAAQCTEVPMREPESTVFLGGEGRRARVWALDADAPALPSQPASFEGGRVLVYLVTPAVFTDGWRPAVEALGGGEVVAAAVGGPVPVASARPDRRTGRVGHARLRWAVAAGSVYYLQFPSSSAATEFAQQWHGRALPQADEVSRTAGFGLALTGRW